MARILVLYATIDGQTRRIAERMSAVLEKAGHVVAVRPADDASAWQELDRHDAVILGASIRYGHFSRELERVVRRRVAALGSRPNAFFSVCLTAGGPGARPEAARRYVDEFRKRTGWDPAETAIFPGALLYTKYSAFNRFMIRLIMTITGGDTDTSRDYEYTDWEAVQRFASTFGSRLMLPSAA